MILWEFHILHPNPTNLPVLPCFPSILVASLSKRKLKRMRKALHSFIFPASPSHLRSLQWPWQLQCLSQTRPFYLNSFTCNEWLAWFKVSASGTLSIWGPHLHFSRISCCCLSQGDYMAVVLQDQSLHMFQQVTEG